jgi:hypothetical protein
VQIPGRDAHLVISPLDERGAAGHDDQRIPAPDQFAQDLALKGEERLSVAGVEKFIQVVQENEFLALIGSIPDSRQDLRCQDLGRG